MNRKDLLTEYMRILNQTEQWLTDGYRKEEPDMEIHIPKDALEDSTVGADGAKEDTPLPNIRQPGFDISTESSSLSMIADEIRNCQRCNLSLVRNNTVPGIGTQGALLMVVTAAPADSAREDMSPLAQHEQEYVEKWLRALDLNPQRDAFFTPAVKCRTPAGRPPEPEEAAACAPYIQRQFQSINPRAVLALGAAACGALTGSSREFPALVSREWLWGGVPALVLWTPSEVLANPKRLRKPVWEALQRLKVAWNALPERRI